MLLAFLFKFYKNSVESSLKVSGCFSLSYNVRKAMLKLYCSRINRLYYSVRSAKDSVQKIKSLTSFNQPYEQPLLLSIFIVFSADAIICNDSQVLPHVIVI